MSKLLAAPAALRVDEAPELLVDFFSWLGVAELPREAKPEAPAQELEDRS